MPPHPLLHRLVEGLGALSGRVLVAVSGGADSVALLRGMVELREELRLSLVVAHLDHQLRGEASCQDARWIERLCIALDIPAVLGSADIAELARHSGCGIEEAARDERYRFLEESAKACECAAVALAHTADDQAETILHHVLRGTGLAGLRGMPRERKLAQGIRLVRPLLDIERALLLDYLAALKQDFREDATNLDESYTRNRIRRQLLPSLARDFNPNVGEALCRLGRQAAEAQQAIDILAGQLLERIIDTVSPGECRLKWQPLVSVPLHLVRESLALLWRRQDWPRQKMGFSQWDELAAIALHGGAAIFPGPIDARREGRWLILRTAANNTKN